MAFFDMVELLPEDPILGLAALFKADPREKKVNLGIGMYQDAEGKPYILNAVRDAEEILQNKSPGKGYLPIEGDPEYLEEALKLVYGADSDVLKAGQVTAAQSVGGCSALRIGGDFLAQEISRTIFLSDPSWSNHKGIFSRSRMNIEYYKYYDQVNRRIDFAGLCASIKLMPPASVILLQPCCHNPSGMDLSFEQWQILSDLIKKQRVFPFFDFAYQGFGEGVEEDARPIRYFVDQGHELIVAQSFSKNFGLYGERVGVVSFVTHKKETTKKILSKIKLIIRESYSNPPMHGAKIIALILKNPALKAGWIHELQNMRDRVKEMRKCLTAELISKSQHQDFSFLSRQQGMFSFSGLNKEQVMRLREERGVYMVSNGRINVAGLNPGNLDYTIDSILSVTTQSSG
jgi:aspartate aminotransferase